MGYVHRGCQAFDLGGRMLKIAINRLPMPLGKHQIFSTCLDIGKHPPQRLSLCPVRHKERERWNKEGWGWIVLRETETASHHPQDIINTSRLGKQLSTNWPLSQLSQSSPHVWGRCFMGGCAVCVWPELLVLVCNSAISGAWSALVWWCTSVVARLKIMPSVCTENCKEDSGNRLQRGDDLWPSTGLFEELLISWHSKRVCKHTLKSAAKFLSSRCSPDRPIWARNHVTLPCLPLTLD